MLGRTERRGNAAERPQSGLQIGGDDSRLQVSVRHRGAGVAQQRAAPEPDAAFVAAHPLGFASGKDHRVRSAAARDGVGLDFHQQRRIDQAADLDQRGRRPDLPEHLGVHTAKRGGGGDVGDEHPRAHDVLKARAGLGQGCGDDLENAPGLNTDIAFANHSALGIYGGCPGNKNLSPHPDGAAVTNLVLPLGSGGNELPAHGLSFACTR